MTNTPRQGYTRLVGSERTLPPNAHQIGPVDPHQVIEVSVYLRDPSSSNLVGDISEHAKQPGQRMTREEYIASHSASPDDLAKVEAFAQKHNLTVVEKDPASRKVTLAGTADAMMSAFDTELQRYEYEGGTFRGRTGHLHIPDELNQIVTGVFGLDDRPQAQPHLRFYGRAGKHHPHANAQTASYTPPQVAQLYDFPTGIDGSGQCVAIIELGGGYTQKGLDAYFKQLGIATPQVISVPVDNGKNKPGHPKQADGEVDLDIQVVGAIAPGARIAVYFAPNTDRGFLDAITQAVHDTTNNPSVISISWGGPESSWTAQAIQAMDQAFQAAASLGITVCAAAGDNGSSDGVTSDKLAHVDFPASDPFVLGCGGTRLDAANKQVTSEVVWNEVTSNEGATGGGVSDSFPLPAWQTNAQIPPSVNDKHAGRGVPDVAGNADPETGYQVFVDGKEGVIGGTSAVAPLWSALIALINQKRGKAVGFLNPFLYQNYQQLLQAKALRDVTNGNNGSYSAGPGWDACTGLGTPDGALLMYALTGASQSGQTSPQQPTLV
jgi:kumamolisin